LSISDHQFVQHQLFRIKHTELNEIFLVMSLRSFVCSMISIFVPIYLLILGFSLRDVLLIQLVMAIVEFSFEFVSASYISKVGPKHAIALSMPPLIAHFWMLSTISTYHWPLWFIAFCGGLALALYWQGYHYDFSKSTKKKEATKNVSQMYITLAVLGAIAPLVGGVIATNFGFEALYVVVIGLLLVVFIPLFKKSEVHTGVPIDIKKINIRHIYRDLISYGGAGIEASMSLVIWPIFVYTAVQSYQSVGFITSAALVITIFVTYFVGRKVNNTNRHKYITTGSFLDGLIFILLTFVNTFTQIISLNMARSLVSSLRMAPYTSEYYLHAGENSRQEYILAMESAIDFAKIIAFSVLIVLSYYLADKDLIIVGLLFGAVGAVMAGLMPRAKCELPYCKNKKIQLSTKMRPKHETS
jgi:hypothetical protein